MGGTWRGIAAGNAVRREAVTVEWDPEVELMEEVEVKMGALVGLAVGGTLMLGNWKWVGVLVVSMSSHDQLFSTIHNHVFTSGAQLPRPPQLSPEARACQSPRPGPRGR